MLNVQEILLELSNYYSLSNITSITLILFFHIMHILTELIRFIF